MTYTNTKTFEKLIKLRGQGIPIKYCAEYVGISERTLTYWLKKGRGSKRSKYYEFALRFDKAFAKLVIYHQSEANKLCSTYQEHTHSLRMLDKRFNPDRKISADVNVKKQEDKSVLDVAAEVKKIIHGD